MRLDLEKIKELELKYKAHPAVLSALNTLVNSAASTTKDLNRTSLQYNTLLELGVILKDDGNKNANPEPLNS